MGTANRMLILLRYMFNLAKKWKIPGAENNPTDGVPLYEANNGRERFLTAEETQRLYSEIEKSDNPQLKYIVPLLLLTGARKRELLDARWSISIWTDVLGVSHWRSREKVATYR